MRTKKGRKKQEEQAEADAQGEGEVQVNGEVAEEVGGEVRVGVRVVKEGGCSLCRAKAVRTCLWPGASGSGGPVSGGIGGLEGGKKAHRPLGKILSATVKQQECSEAA